MSGEQEIEGTASPWRLLAVGDIDAGVKDLRHGGRGVELLAARDADEACRVLGDDPAIAVVLCAGAEALERRIRTELKNRLVRVLPNGGADAVRVALSAYVDLLALLAANEALERTVADRSRELEEANLILERLATTDPLTGIVNRRRFMDIASREVLRSKRTGAAISVIVLDIDHFKAVNDRHGHAAGDAVLLEVANRAGMALRTLDVLGRLGGEEFAIILPEAGLDGARIVAERLREAIAATPMYAGDGLLNVTVSLGVAALNADETLDGLLNRADAALYAAKLGGRDRVMLA